MRSHLLKQQERRLALGLGRAGPDDLLFARWDGSLRSPDWLTQKFALAMKTLKIEGVTPHCLQHTHASHLIAAGIDILTVSRRLGHGSAALTLKVYGHLVEGADERAADSAETLIGGAS
jgi:integrase